ncbi:UNVERIFIED_CONTAM: hypothetical protein OHV15_05300 [Microbacterium sp. SLM126]
MLVFSFLRIIVPTVVVALTLSIVSGAQAATASDRTNEGEVAFSVLGDLEASVGQEVSLANLTALG